MKPFLRWWIIICVVGIGLFFLFAYGGINYINDADFTKLSFIIMAIFIYCSVQVGYHTNKRPNNGIGFPAFPVFAVGLMTKLGMTGTVLGFIKMLSTCLGNINMQNVQSMQAVLSEMSQGMSTALVTTAAGLICSILLQLQIFNYEHKN